MEDPDDPTIQDEVAMRLMAYAAQRRAEQEAGPSDASEATAPDDEEKATG